MKFIPAEDGQVLHRLELSRRNLEILLAKLDDPLSKRQLVDPDWHIVVAATEDAVETDKGYFVPGRPSSYQWRTRSTTPTGHRGRCTCLAPRRRYESRRDEAASHHQRHRGTFDQFR